MSFGYSLVSKITVQVLPINSAWWKKKIVFTVKLLRNDLIALSFKTKETESKHSVFGMDPVEMLLSRISSAVEKTEVWGLAVSI